MIPKRLNRETLVEALWDIRFETDENFIEVAPGILYSHLKKFYNNLRIERLPTYNLPVEIRSNDPNLRYAPTLRIETTEDPFVWQIGNRIFTFNNKMPYVGWEKFSREIKSLMDFFFSNFTLKKVENAYLRYINLIPNSILDDLSGLKLKLKIGNWDIKKDKVNIIVKKDQEQLSKTIQILSPMSINVGKNVLLGTIIDIEVGYNKFDEITKKIPEKLLENIHFQIKEIFFSILSEETLKKLEPEY